MLTSYAHSGLIPADRTCNVRGRCRNVALEGCHWRLALLRSARTWRRTHECAGRAQVRVRRSCSSSPGFLTPASGGGARDRLYKLHGDESHGGSSVLRCQRRQCFVAGRARHAGRRPGTGLSRRTDRADVAIQRNELHHFGNVSRHTHCEHAGIECPGAGNLHGPISNISCQATFGAGACPPQLSSDESHTLQHVRGLRPC
jgi:hypothetical protein